MALTVPVNQPIVAEDDFQYTRNTVWRRFRKHKLAIAGCVILLLLVLAAAFAKFISPFDPNTIDNTWWKGYPVPPCFQDAAHCGGHILGTDENGRDLLSRLIYGAQISLTVGVFAVVMEIIIGTVLGSVAGYYGGWIDWIVMRITD
ncbi:MAG: ABC transporter permease, partial [Candidatus Eremiobacteraeota bacterium]|nr:ABC transporter permease [Candidatus Eremiobacteraeota bacterium]